MMAYDAAELAQDLARNAEAVCRHYLSNGRRLGHYWTVGDIRNTPGRSLFVRLKGPLSGKGVAGKWQDSATGEYGDLLDVIRESCGLRNFKYVVEEARSFLRQVQFAPVQQSRSRTGSAQRLIAMSQGITGTVVETYLRKRGITALHAAGALHFHPRCYYRPDSHSPTETWPAMIACVTDPDNRITGAHRTWLSPDGSGKAPIDTPRRALGELLGNAVRFDQAGAVMAAGEGIETMLSLRMALPQMPMVAALSAAHLGRIRFTTLLRRLYIARDADAAGDYAVARLVHRAQSLGIETLTLSPQRGDFNDDLSTYGPDALRAGLRGQLTADDIARFM